MVFFTCNGCGESLKKGQVEKHTAVCRNCKCLSCIDCGKDFWGEDYKTHLKCITEDQKYGGKGFEAKAHKGDVKQQQWLQRISEAMKRPNINPKLKNILNQLGAYENIPRKKAKFQNWMKNSIKIYDQTLQEQVWDIVSQATDSENKAANNGAPKASDAAGDENKSEASVTAEETEKKKSKRERKEERQAKKNKKEKKDLNSEEPAENGTKKKSKKRKAEEECNAGDDEETTEEAATEKMTKKKKSRTEDKQVPQKKRKQDESEEEQQEEETGEDPAEADEDSAQKGKFNWKGTIKALLKQAPDNELAVKKLRKKVISQYYATSSDQHKSEEELLSTFNKKIQNNPKFRLLKEKVKLIK